MSVFVHVQGIKTVHAGWGVKKWQNSVHVVVECPLNLYPQIYQIILTSNLCAVYQVLLDRNCWVNTQFHTFVYLTHHHRFIMS